MTLWFRSLGIRSKGASVVTFLVHSLHDVGPSHTNQCIPEGFRRHVWVVGAEDVDHLLAG